MAALNQQPGPGGEGNFADRVKAVQDALAEGVAKAGLQRDPYRYPIAAISKALGLFPELVHHLEATRQPVQDEDMRKAVARGIADAGREILWTLKVRNVLIAAGLLVAALLIGGAGGYLTARAQLSSDVAGLSQALSGPDAALWRRLISINDIRAVWKNCRDAPQPTGGSACAFTLWTQRTPPAQ